MHWHAVWARLVALGFDKDVLAALVATAVGSLGARLAAWRPLKRHNANQERIADLLDTSTPGGLGDLAGAIADALDQPRQHPPAAPPPPGGHHGAR